VSGKKAIRKLDGPVFGSLYVLYFLDSVIEEKFNDKQDFNT
jgi:hypothetical protein